MFDLEEAIYYSVVVSVSWRVCDDHICYQEFCSLHGMNVFCICIIFLPWLSPNLVGFVFFFYVASLYLHFSQRSLPNWDYLMRFTFFPTCLLVFLMCVFPSVLTSAKSCYYISGQSEGWFHSWRWLSCSFQWRWIGWWRRRWWLFWVCLCNLWQWWRAFVVCFLAGYWSWSSIFFGFALQNKSSTFYLFC